MPSPSTTPPTIRDVALAAGVSVATVSRALGGNRDISAATRAHVLGAAERLGYRRNMAAAILGATGKSGARPGQRLALGLVYQVINPERDLDVTQAFATEAAAHGHQANIVTITDLRSLPRALRELHARGCEGLLVQVPGADQHGEAESWARFAVVGLASCARARFHHVRRAHFDDLTSAWEQLVSRGYRRIGAAILSHARDEPDDHARLGAVLVSQARFPRLAAIPPFTATFETAAAAFPRWMREHKPDVVIGFGVQCRWWLKDLGLRTPEDCGLLLLHGGGHRWPKQAANGQTISGFRVPTRASFEIAVPLLESMLAKRVFGPPPKPQLIEFNAEWVEGDTLRPR